MYKFFDNDLKALLENILQLLFNEYKCIKYLFTFYLNFFQEDTE